MTHDLKQWPGADDLLDGALALPEAERLPFLRRAAGHDPALLAALEAVVLEAASDDDFLVPGTAMSGTLGAELGRALDVHPEPAHVLDPGTFIEHYEIVELIGRGGMGEVYRAHDTRLKREVAIKVLPGQFARDPDRRARFQREARVLASLSHPGIAAIYGVAEEDDLEALVLELVEGPTLAERLDGRALPLDEALAIGRRLAEALEAAHNRGILHRDLKPANVKVDANGAVKVLDFGLAKALASDTTPPDETDVTARAPDIILGTPGYMSPERIRGERTDERADIWAFGCVLFEMLTGTRAFAGASAPEVLARVIEREPAFGLLPPGTPPAIRRLLRRTLEKDPRRRLGYIGDAILEFDEAMTPERGPEEPRRRAPLKTALWLAGGVVAGALATWGLLRTLPSTSAPSSLVRLAVPLPPGDVPATSFQPAVALSPNGRMLVYRARRGSDIQLFRRDLHELEPRLIPGTERGTGPFFSPDGRWIGFDGDGVLKRVSIEGGPPIAICPAPGGVTATWLSDDTIVFATNTSRVLQRVAASGGTPVAVTTLDQQRGDTLHLLPQALPGVRAVLFTSIRGASREVAVLNLDSGVTRVVAEGTHGRYLPTGHLVFWRDGSLWGVRFDVRRLTTIGSAVPLDERIEHTDNTVLHFDVSPDGTLAYLPVGSNDTTLQQLVWIDRERREHAVELEPRPYTRVSLAPGGSRLALALEQDGNTDVWIADPRRKTMSRLTLDPTIETMPVWSPDGRHVAFRSEREGPGIFRRDADGAGPIERLTATDGPIHSPYSWTPDGRTLLFAIFRSFRRQAIASVTPPDRAITILLDGEFAQLNPQVSPDGRCLAYQSDESGQFEIYVRPYPAVQTARWQASIAGGTSPRWSRDGRELFYLDGTGLLAVPIRTDTALVTGAPRRLFDVSPFGGRLGAAYEVSPDGQRFLFIVNGPPLPPRTHHIVFTQRWTEALETRLARSQ